MNVQIKANWGVVSWKQFTVGVAFKISDFSFCIGEGEGKKRVWDRKW